MNTRGPIARWVPALLGILAILLPSNRAAAQGNTLRLESEDGTIRGVIGVFKRHSTTYASLGDIASTLSLTTFSNPATRKFEVKGGPNRLVASARNSFITIINQNNSRSIYQLDDDVITAADAWFVPLESFIPLFRIAFGKPAQWDGTSGIVRVTSGIAYTGFDFSTIAFETKANGMLLRIPTARPLTEFESWLKRDGWLYVTIAGAKADTTAINALKPSGLVRRIIAIQSPTSVQLTFKLAGKIAASEITRDAATNEILISLRTPGSEEKQLLEKKQREVRADLENQRKRWKLDVIVLDAGHGGKDYGALGVTKVKEKDITLGITLKLGKLLEKNLKTTKVVYTRKDDTFIELHRRGQIANEADGKLFISIHCNSLRRKPSPTRGFEVYLLRPGRTEEAIEIAERENAVIELEEDYEQRYQKLTDENFILVTMAQSAHVKASEAFADVAQSEMEARTGLQNRGVKQAGFYVLVGASMPNVLVETAYLSNRDDEKFLKSDAGQTKLAEALFQAIKKYKEEYEKLLLEGKEIE
jgi:N-acetylmuramoyl-L-alanine amidase